VTLSFSRSIFFLQSFEALANLPANQKTVAHQFFGANRHSPINHPRIDFWEKRFFIPFA